MKTHSKTIFILLGTLAIGIVIGVLGQSNIHNRRMEKIAEMRRQGGLYASVDKYIDPVDTAQEDTLRALAKEYQDKLGRFYGHYQWHRSRLMDSLKTDMTPLLTAEQNAQIEPWFERMIRKPKSAKRDSSMSKNSASSSDSTSISSDSTTVPSSSN